MHVYWFHYKTFPNEDFSQSFWACIANVFRSKQRHCQCLRVKRKTLPMTFGQNEGTANFPYQISLVSFHLQYRNEDCATVFLKWTDFRILVWCPDQTCSIAILIQKSLLTFLKTSIWSFEPFRFSTNFLSNMILQCMTIYLYWEKPVWLWYQYWIRPNIAANKKNSGISLNHEKSSYRTNCRIFIINMFS